MSERPLPDGATRIYSSSIGTGTLTGDPIFPMPRRSFTPAPKLIGSNCGPDSWLWVVASPSWGAAAGPLHTVPFGASPPPHAYENMTYFCPPSGACAVHGPRCSGDGGSGWIYNLFPSLSLIPQQVTVTTPGAVTSVIDPATGDITYQTQHPYAPGSLRLSFQGQALGKGIDYDELDPSQGTFIVHRLVPEENAGELYVEYFGYGDQITTPAPGVPPTEPGEPPPFPGAYYRPASQRQFGWGTAYDSVNCNMACSAMLLDRHTMGANTRYVGSPQSIPPAHRFYSGVTAITGTGHDDAKRAWTNGWHQTYTYTGPVPWSYFVYQIQVGRGSTVFGRYAYMDEQYKKSKTFDGPHAIYVNEQLEDGSFWGYDPIVGYPIVYPYGVLQAYADSYHGFHDRIEAGFSRVTARTAV